jgi:hypothetical protein
MILAHEHITIGRDFLPTGHFGKIGIMAETQAVLSHHSDVVGQIR